MNEAWANAIIDNLVQSGITYFCISPGSRSTLLAIAIANHPEAEMMVHFDERGTAFHALGWAKAAQKPAAILVTTGTAVGNLFPAVMEAFHSHTPLIVLTADRPPELQDCSANQTAHQTKFFGDYVRWHFEIPCAEASLSAQFLASTISYAVHRAISPDKGPVHLNCLFREPFISSPPLQATITKYEPLQKTLPSEVLEKWAQKLSQIEKGVIIAGALPAADRRPLLDLAVKLDWPIFADPLSGLRENGEHSHLIAHYTPMLKTLSDIKPEAILHFGDRFVSKPLMEWINRHRPELYCLVAEHSERVDQSHAVTHRITVDPSTFCRGILPYVPQGSSWAGMWKEWSAEIHQRLQEYFAAQTEISEPSVAHWLSHTLSPDFALFISSSMPIRDIDSFFFPKKPSATIFSNRGVSGIDGNIATAIGISVALKRPTIALLGDLAALHDINSLAQLKKSPYPVICLINNNQGGGIFSFLPVANKTQHFEELFGTPHPFDFQHAAALFQMPYFRLEGTDRPFLPNESCIVEIASERQKNFTLHQEIANETALFTGVSRG